MDVVTLVIVYFNRFKFYYIFVFFLAVVVRRRVVATEMKPLRIQWFVTGNSLSSVALRPQDENRFSATLKNRV